ncbi:class I fructose-bisphosphate aldolase [Microbacterium aerolatum]|uniref:Aldolase n=1 Tax=Microbacterium aerolatum TaxID=153731 RepID=A0A511ABY3_9MICO|nr:aldolase [Microbacterium aerolatum]GEK85684.1 aldolase [Microbacterium aerolatum]GGB21204.1 aldolase [Microbacterium aerolatum]
MTTNTPRLNRLFANDGRCLDVAVDHGLTNEHSFLNGIEDMTRVVDALVAAGPDAIQLTPGMARHLQNLPGKEKPSLVMRTDSSNVYYDELPRFLFSQVLEGAVERAVALDATCVVVNLLLLPDQPELHHQSVTNVARVRRQCDLYGMPLMVEPLVMLPNSIAGGYQVDGDLTKITTLVRQGVELGADIIKADPCTDASDFHKVVETAAGIPVLVRGGGLASDQLVLDRSAEVMRQGAKGLVYGRNIIQHSNPVGMVKALMSIIHDDSTGDQAMSILQEHSAENTDAA